MRTASDYLVQRLFDWGVRRVYGYPGDGINGVMGALNREQEKVQFIQTRHEEEAAFMACAHAKFTGEVGVCIATSGPGAIHLLNGLYDAKLDHQPVAALGADYQQEVDLISPFKDAAHHYVQMATGAGQIRQLVDRAIRIALAERTVTCIILPNDVQEMDAVTSPERRHGTTFTGLGFTRPEVVPLPPHITFEQARGFMSSLFKGDPNLGGIVKQSARQMMSTLLSRSEK